VKRLLAITAAFLAVSCSSITEGTITDKKFYDEYTTLMPIYTYGTNGQITGMYTQEIYTPPCWEFYLRNGDDVGSQCVDPRDWMVHNVGDFYAMPDDEEA
jgi:hypothetical protein